MGTLSQPQDRKEKRQQFCRPAHLARSEGKTAETYIIQSVAQSSQSLPPWPARAKGCARAISSRNCQRATPPRPTNSTKILMRTDQPTSAALADTSVQPHNQPHNQPHSQAHSQAHNLPAYYLHARTAGGSSDVASSVRS